VKRSWSPGQDGVDHGVRGARLSKSRKKAGIGSMPKERRKAPRRGTAFLQYQVRTGLLQDIVLHSTTCIREGNNRRILKRCH
jgi:hypothetical protein